MKENYKAWDLSVDDFYKLQTEEEKLKFLIRFAVLAPSSHNTQPWAFSVSKNSINVHREAARRLPVADVSDRQLTLSLGCALENILIAAEYYGYTAHVEYKNEYSADHLIATITFEQNKNSIGEKNKEHLVHSIMNRKTNRSKYKNDSIDRKIIDKIKSLENDDIRIYVIDDKEKIKNLGEVAVLASIESLVDDAFRKELSHHVKHNLTTSKVGMPGFSQGLPTPVSFLLPSLIKRFNMEKAAQKQNEVLFREFTPYVVVIAVKSDNPVNWLKAGEIFQHIALLTTKNNISISPWGAPIEIGEFYKNVQDIGKISERPVMFFRMGYVTKNIKGHSPRLTVDDVIKK